MCNSIRSKLLWNDDINTFRERLTNFCSKKDQRIYEQL